MTPLVLNPRRAALIAVVVCATVIAFPFLSAIWTKGSAFGFPVSFLLVGLGLPVALVWVAAFCAPSAAPEDQS